MAAAVDGLRTRASLVVVLAVDHHRHSENDIALLPYCLRSTDPLSMYLSCMAAADADENCMVTYVHSLAMVAAADGVVGTCLIERQRAGQSCRQNDAKSLVWLTPLHRHCLRYQVRSSPHCCGMAGQQRTGHEPLLVDCCCGC